MDTNERKHIIQQIGYLEINHCDGCTIHNTNLNHLYTCKGCPVYAEIKQLGQKLAGEQSRGYKRTKLTVPMFVKYRMEGFGYKDIAEAIGTDAVKVQSWYYSNRAKIDQYIEG